MKAFKTLRWLLPLTLVGAACSSILGIEDIHPDPKPGTGEGGEGNGSGGTSGGKGGTSGASGTGKGGTSGASGSTSTGGTSGDAGGGGDAGSSGTTGGSGGAPDETVHGRVVTHWRQPIPDVLVTIGAADAITNANGEFEIPDVAPQYDASFTLSYNAGGGRLYGWVYQGLTRRDPTLMVYEGNTERSTQLVMTFDNLVLDSMSSFSVALGDPSGTSYSGVTTGVATRTAYWFGPATTTVTAHALLWRVMDDLPTNYTSYDSTLLALSSGGMTAATLDMGGASVASGTIQGMVTAPSADVRSNQVFVRFNDNATIQLLDDYPLLDPNGAFTYTVPSIPGSSITVSAAEDGATGYAVVHRDGLAAGANNIELAIPAPVLLNAPASSITGVDSTTLFRWNGTTNAYLWYIENVGYYEGLRVVTGAESGTIPVMPDGFELRAGEEHFWRIQTHGSATSVDEMCGPEGYGDSFGFTGGTDPVGPRQGNGSYTVSLARGFTVAP